MEAPPDTHTDTHRSPFSTLSTEVGLDAAGEEEDGVTQLQQSAASAKRWIQHEGQHDRGERWSHRTEDRWYYSGERQGQFNAGSPGSSFFNTSMVVTIKCFLHFEWVTSAFSSSHITMAWTFPAPIQPTSIIILIIVRTFYCSLNIYFEWCCRRDYSPFVMVQHVYILRQVEFFIFFFIPKLLFLSSSFGTKSNHTSPLVCLRSHKPTLQLPPWP